MHERARALFGRLVQAAGETTANRFMRLMIREGAIPHARIDQLDDPDHLDALVTALEAELEGRGA
jgi:hypothetical protein